MFGVQEINAIGLKTLLDSDEEIYLIDVRSQGEFAQGIIQGAEFLPLHTLPMKLDDFRVNRIDKKIVFYCRTDARSGQACQFLKQHTGIDAFNLRGGIVDWYRSGHDIVRPT